MARIRPVYGFALVLAFAAAILLADYALDGGFGRNYERVTPDAEGRVEIDVGSLEPLQVRFFRFLNRGNQEVKFFVGRDSTGEIQVAFDAAESDYKRRRGFRHQGEWVVNNKCETATRLREVNQGGGGCRPVPLAHTVQGDRLILTEPEILRGWRYFR